MKKSCLLRTLLHCTLTQTGIQKGSQNLIPSRISCSIPTTNQENFLLVDMDRLLLRLSEREGSQTGRFSVSLSSRVVQILIPFLLSLLLLQKMQSCWRQLRRNQAGAAFLLREKVLPRRQGSSKMIMATYIN